MPDSVTVEGIFETSQPGQSARLGNALATEVSQAITARIGSAKGLGVALINLAGDILGVAGDLSPWK